MFSHVFVGVSDFERALRFYEPLMASAHYHPHCYGAYFRDPDGNKFRVAFHDPAPEDTHA